MAIIIIIIIIIMVVKLFGHGLSRSLVPETHVSIQNVLEGNDDLTAHCRSNDDDIGVKLVKYQDAFEFRFRANLFGGTLFYCRFEWNGACQWFNIYDEQRDLGKCERCNWHITKNGPCREVSYNTDTCYEWRSEDSC
ncbi:MAG: self-incompatibility S1 family protein [Pigeon pea little leaf phytoplasma]|nr:self-incompatibility S1 family protein [Pigeon pea little leaf phytoplasma]